MKQFLRRFNSRKKRNKGQKQTRPQTAVGYIRVSDDKQLTNHSLETQESMLIEYAESKGIRLLAIFREEAVSAKEFENRPAWTDLLEYLETAEEAEVGIGYVLVTMNDRFSRNYFAAATMRSYLRKRFGVAVASLQNALDPDHVLSSIIDAILDILAELDNLNRSARTLTGMQAASKKGYHLGSAPFGYVRSFDPEIGRNMLQVVDEEAAVVQYVFETYGRSTAAVSEIYEAIKDRFPHREQYLYDLLRNPRYCGEIPDTMDRDVLHLGHHKPIVSKELFQLVQERLAANTRTVSTDTSVDEEQSWLKNMLYCDVCGTKLTFSRSSGNGGSYAYYHCRTRKCPTRVAPDVAEEFMTDALVQFQRQLPSYYGKLFEVVYEDFLTQKLKDLDKRKSDLAKLIHEQKVALDNATFRYASNKLTEERYLSFERSTAKHLLCLEAELNSCIRERDVHWHRASIGKNALSNPVMLFAFLPRTSMKRQFLNHLGIDQLRIKGKDTFVPIFRKDDISDPDSTCQIQDEQP